MLRLLIKVRLYIYSLKYAGRVELFLSNGCDLERAPKAKLSVFPFVMKNRQKYLIHSVPRVEV